MGLLICAVTPVPAAAKFFDFGLRGLGFSTVSGSWVARTRSAVFGSAVGSGSQFAMARSSAMGETSTVSAARSCEGARPSNPPIGTGWARPSRSGSQPHSPAPKCSTLVLGYFKKSNPQYPGIKTYLQLVQERQISNPDYVQLFVLLSQLRTYIATTKTKGLQSNTLREWFIAAMEEANRMEAIIAVDQPVRDADLAFRAEMLTLLGQQRIREEEAKEAKANGGAKAKNKKRLMAAAAGGVLVAVGSFTAGPAAAVGALKLIGFSSAGPAVGSLAAIVQSAAYGGAVGAGSLFAKSAAMGGIALGSPAQTAAGVAALGTASQTIMPGLLAATKIALVLGGTVAVAPALAVGGLGLLGFSAAGPVAGTVAAGIQSAVYGGTVASGSLFATAQAAAMGGITVSAVQTVGGALGYVVVVLI